MRFDLIFLSVVCSLLTFFFGDLDKFCLYRVLGLLLLLRTNYNVRGILFTKISYDVPIIGGSEKITDIYCQYMFFSSRAFFGLFGKGCMRFLVKIS